MATSPISTGWNLRATRPASLSDNREELARSKDALVKAAEGHDVAVVSGGDPGVFAMAAAVCEAIEAGPAEWRAVDVAVVPGITAMLAVAARIGAPLGHDFCAISLSDNLKPWDLIELRLLAAAGAGFVIALYNPISKARPWQLGRAFECLTAILPGTTPVIFGRAAGRRTSASRSSCWPMSTRKRPTWRPASSSARLKPGSSSAAKSRRWSTHRVRPRVRGNDRPQTG